MPDFIHDPKCSVAEPIGICTCGLFLKIAIDGGSDTMTKEQDTHWRRLIALNRQYAMFGPVFPCGAKYNRVMAVR